MRNAKEKKMKKDKVGLIIGLGIVIGYFYLMLSTMLDFIPIPKSLILPCLVALVSPTLIKISLYYFVTKSKKQQREEEFKKREETYKELYTKLSARKEPTIVPFPVPTKK